MLHLDHLETLRTAYLSLKKEVAPGVDGETWRNYGETLEDNLQDLSHRLKRGAYRAKPVRRVYIPKADGRQRPLGVPALEDKIVQRAAVEVLNVPRFRHVTGSRNNVAAIISLHECSPSEQHDDPEPLGATYCAFGSTK